MMMIVIIKKEVNRIYINEKNTSFPLIGIWKFQSQDKKNGSKINLINDFKLQ